MQYYKRKLEVTILPNGEAPIAPNPGVPGLPNGIDIPADAWPKAGVDVPKTTQDREEECNSTALLG